MKKNKPHPITQQALNNGVKTPTGLQCYVLDRLNRGWILEKKSPNSPNYILYNPTLKSNCRIVLPKTVKAMLRDNMIELVDDKYRVSKPYNHISLAI